MYSHDYVVLKALPDLLLVSEYFGVESSSVFLYRVSPLHETGFQLVAGVVDFRATP